MNLIAAISNDYSIGNDSQMLWHIPAELKLFKQITLNKIVVMGSTTFFQVGILSKRINYVLTSGSLKSSPNNLYVFNTPASLIENLKQYPREQIFIIGGTQIYELFLSENLITRAYISHIKGNYTGNKKFPFHHIANWQRELYYHDKDFTTYIYTK